MVFDLFYFISDGILLMKQTKVHRKCTMGTNFKPGKECLGFYKKKKPVCMKFLSSLSIKINELFKSQLLTYNLN